MAALSPRGAKSAMPATCAKAWSVASWNVAAINNNPWEYYMDHPNPQYDEIMAGVEALVSAPGAADVAVSAVFTDAMAASLAAAMRGAGLEEAAVAYAEAAWLGERHRRLLEARASHRGRQRRRHGVREDLSLIHI